MVQELVKTSIQIRLGAQAQQCLKWEVSKVLFLGEMPERLNGAVSKTVV